MTASKECRPTAPCYPWPERADDGLSAHTPLVEDEQAALAAVTEWSPDLVVILGPEGLVRYASPSAMAMLGRPPDWLRGQPFAGVVHADDRSKLADLCRAQAPIEPTERRGPVVGELRLSRLNGDWVDTEVTVTDLTGDARVGNIVLNLRDARARKAAENKLRQMALYDSLTGLANRGLFRDHVERALAHRRRTKVCHAVLFIDLDGFKTINDSLGHAAGDEILLSVADRLRFSVRPGDVIARLGGDEFAILIENTSESAAAFFAQRVIELLRGGFQVQGKEVTLSGSVGVALSEFADDSDQFLRNADVAMYRAKATGKNGHAIFRPEMHLAALKRLDLEADLRLAIERQQLMVHYQPIVNLGTGEVEGVEALVRWQHSEKGLIPPLEFIPVAEEIGLIRAIGLFVLEETCAQSRAWLDQFPAVVPFRICVNVSVHQIEHESFASDVASCLRRTGLPPANLTLEITESLFLGDGDAAVARLHTLKQLGITLAIDDFGTGYSSLSYLRSLPIDVLKIDKSFVDGVTSGPERSAVAKAIVKLAGTFGLQTVAEGIESPEQAAELAAMGANMGQGYLYGRPMGAAAMEHFLCSHVSKRPGSPKPVLVQSTR